MTAAVIVAHHERGKRPRRRERAPLAAGAEHRRLDAACRRCRADLDELGDDRPASEADLAISLGGDGTMLRTVELLGGAPP